MQPWQECSSLDLIFGEAELEGEPGSFAGDFRAGVRLGQGFLFQGDGLGLVDGLNLGLDPQGHLTRHGEQGGLNAVDFAGVGKRSAERQGCQEGRIGPFASTDGQPGDRTDAEAVFEGLAG